MFSFYRFIHAPFSGIAALALCALFVAPSSAQTESAPVLKKSDGLSMNPAQTALTAAPLKAKDYRIGTEDLLEIQVFGVDQLSRTVRVNSRGQISLPLIGSLDVGGLTAQEAETLVAAKLTENFMQNPQVSLFIKEYTSQRITVEGAVARPGIYPLRGQTSLLQTLALAGGGASMSDLNEVMLFRTDTNGNRSTLTYDVERIRKGELGDPTVVNDDIIVVKRSAGRAMLKDSLFRDVLDTINPFK